MTPSLIGQRARSELIAELYERHAAGLFAYCHDQLGESTSAADAVVAVFTSVPIVEPPPRAALFALARREIYRRDVSYALPAVDSIVDPATALIERVFRDIRPHQREVLLLSAVCGLDTQELAWVLDVAADTADELIASARQRFTQTLTTATAAARSAPFVASDVAEVYDAIGVAPIKDVLARLPWRRPVSAVRARVLSHLPLDDQSVLFSKRTLPTKKLWPTTPTWPLPLTDPNQVSNTCVVSTDALTPPKPGRRSRHEETTQPMPSLRGAILTALTESRARKRRTPSTPSGSPASPASAASRTASAPAPPAAPGSDTGLTPEETSAVGSFDTSDSFDAFAAFRPPDTENRPSGSGQPAGKTGTTGTILSLYAGSSVPVEEPAVSATPAAPAAPTAPVKDSSKGPAKKPTKKQPSRWGRKAAPAAVDVDTQPAQAPTTPAWQTADGAADAAAVEVSAEGTSAAQAEPATKTVRRTKVKPVKNVERHYDWLWELIGFAICVAIALIVFFTVPMIVTP